MRPNGTGKQLFKRRQRALELIEQGNSTQEVANKVKATERSIRRWKQEQRGSKKEK
jgi:transposase